MYDDSDYCRAKRDCRCHRCCEKKPERDRSGAFKSCYLEAVGDIQTTATNSDIIFDIDPDSIDIAGHGISINSAGRVIRITRPGLYHIEWSVNIAPGTLPICIGIMENGSPTSAISTSVEGGFVSSGALINVKNNDLPMEITLRNFGAPINITRGIAFENTAASIRILRFADGESVFYNER